MQAVILIVPLSIILLIMLLQKEKGDFSQAVLSFTLSLGFTGVLTNVLKIIVGKSMLTLFASIYRFYWREIIKKLFVFLGRPRPDFFYRCFPDGQVNFEFECTGDPAVIKDGKKSFPSGHSSRELSSNQ